jgi:hypothetical protein
MTNNHLEDDVEQQLQTPRQNSNSNSSNQNGQTHCQPTSNNSDEWTSDIEELVKRWKSQIEKLSHVHQESGYINRTRYYRLSIPSILLPFIMTLVSQNFYSGTNDTSHIIDGVMFMTTSILSALLMFFNYNQLSEVHFQTSSRYADIANRIDSELARRRKFRTPSDVFVTELKGSIESLGDNAPQLPGTWC